MKNDLSDQQKKIIEVSGKILMKKGIKGLTTKTLAKEMGFTEGAIYRHFKTKEDIIILLLEVIQNDMERRLGEFNNLNSTAVDKLKSIFKSQFKFFQENPHFIIAVLSEGLFDESKRINSTVLKIVGYKSSILSQIVEKGIKLKEFTTVIDNDDMVHILMGTFRLQLLKWKFSKFSLDLEKEGNKKIESVLQLLTYSK